ncbi:hypothetical protein [Azospirillum halopraeferens]|uniref:hypothetical protein n=1 Tax=Azospirillum halopraeferens TaxID=34010 RepID=UPI00042185D1|nr:hypothetical protein [Azospirillum halopraeferens]
MSRRRLAVSVLLGTGLAVAGAALPVAAQTTDAAAGERPRWMLGALPQTVLPPDRADRLGDLHDKFRMGGALVPWMEPYATLKPWVTTEPAPDGRLAGTGGLLLDVPLGSFTFTPSIGAGYVPLSPAESRGNLEIRSQIELGYEFSNDARLALGYSRITGSGNRAEDRVSDNVFSFTFRLPFGSLVP